MEIDFTKQFIGVFYAGGSPEAECNCGRTHVAVDASSWEESYYEDQLQSYINRAHSGDTSVVLHEQDDFVGIIEIGGKVFVDGCECKGWEPYMNFLINEQRKISQFIIAARAELQRVTAQFDLVDKLSRDYTD